MGIMENLLNNFGPVYIINLKSREDRLSHIKNEFNKYNIKDYTIIEAIDGSNDDLSFFVDDIESIPLSSNEIACSISHLKAIKQWLDTSDSNYALIIEDDFTFETVENWQMSWEEFLKSIDIYYDMIQLSIINIGRVNTSLHYREIRDSSTCCYLITRSWAESLMKKHMDRDKFLFKGISRNRAVADGLVYSEAVCLAFPLFVASNKLGSSINESHVDTIHKKSRDEVLDFWKTKPKGLYRELSKNV